MIGRAGRRILVFEDETMAAVMLERMLGKLGYRVAGKAGTVTAALAVIKMDTQDIDAVILDGNLGVEGSEEVAGALEAYELPFIVTTGYLDRQVLTGFEGRPIIYMPFVSWQLEQALRALDPPRPELNRLQSIHRWDPSPVLREPTLFRSVVRPRTTPIARGKENQMQRQEQPGKHGAPYAPPNSPEYKTLIRQLDALLTKIEALPAGSTALPQLQNELEELRERCRGVWLRDQGLDGIGGDRC
jgi:CheY-like chemotaxis protein